MGRTLAYMISVIFHPLLIPTYMLAILMLVNPFIFGTSQIGEFQNSLLLLQIFLQTAFLPAIAVMMMKFIGFVDSLELKDKTERIGPFIITGLLYIWVYINLSNNTTIPPIFSAFILGGTISLFLAFLVNIFEKVSLHATGMGTLLGMVLITTFLYDFTYIKLMLGGYLVEFDLSILLMFIIFITGLVGSSRLRLEAHSPRELVGGIVIGLFSQIVALKFIV